MPRIDIELLPVDHITADAIGPKGQRVFYLQATKDEQVVTLIAEKFQIQSLAVGVEQFLVEVLERYPDKEEASADYDESSMHIYPPVDPLFRLEEPKKHTITLCTSTSSHLNGGGDMLTEIHEKIAQSGADVTVETARCLGAPNVSPTIIIDGEMFSGADAQAKITEIISQ